MRPQLSAQLGQKFNIKNRVSRSLLKFYFFLKFYLLFSLIVKKKAQKTCCLMKYFRNGVQFCRVTSVLAKNITVKVAKPIKKNGHSRYILQGRLHVRSLFFFSKCQ